MGELLLYETHCHTPLCKHATGEPEQYAQTAWERGLRGLAITCHNPMPDGFAPSVRMGADQLRQYVELVARAEEAWSGRVDVLLGLEAEYFPGYEGWVERQLREAEFQYVLGSVHPQLREFEARFGGCDALSLQVAYFQLLADAAETRLYDCLAHPDVVKIVVPNWWRPRLIMDDVRRALDRIAAVGVAMEVNTSGVNKPVPEINPFPEMLAEMRRRSIPVVVGSDAHEPDRVGDKFPEALELLAAAGYEQVCVFRERQRRELSIADFRSGLERARTTFVK
jgi:histidinol-phosphatase (PHP family)